MASTIVELEREVEGQPDILSDALSSPSPAMIREGSLLIGAGDSYAAAVCASQLSSLRFLACDPLAALKVLEAEPRDLCIISVSGRTRTNLEAARMGRTKGRRIVAVTASRASPLGRLADIILELPFKPAARSPGMLSFSLTLLTVLRATLPPFRCDFHRAFAQGTALAGSFRLSPRGTTFLLGDWALYGVSLYGAAKVEELLAMKAQAVYLEQFGHGEVLSLSRRDTVNILSGLGSAKAPRRLLRELSLRRYSASDLRPAGTDDIERLFASVFAVQLGVLRAARRLGVKEARFLDADGLAISDAMIY